MQTQFKIEVEKCDKNKTKQAVFTNYSFVKRQIVI